MNKLFALGIDLHGTLLNADWAVSEQLIPQIGKALTDLSSYGNFYICTGNDQQFVESYVDARIRELMSGYVLETGSVYSDKYGEEIIVGKDTVALIKETQKMLQEQELPDLLFYGNRLATVSLFTKDENRGVSPRRLWQRVSEIIAENGLAAGLTVTHSDVAVDIVAAGVDKYTGIRNVSSLPVLAIADSMNDSGLLAKADISFIPANSFPFGESLHGVKITIKPLCEFAAGKDNVLTEQCSASNRDCSVLPQQKTTQTLYRSSLPNTEGVLEILQTLHCRIRNVQVQTKN